MDFELSEDQRLIKDSVNRLLAARYGDARQRLAYAQEPGGWSRAVWREYAELGLLAGPFEERFGGLAHGPVDAMLLAEALGRALALEPYLAAVVLGGGLVRHGGSARQKQALIPEIAHGRLVLALAHMERDARFDLAHTATTARRDAAGGYVLDGEKTVVTHGDSADKLIVTARIGGNVRDGDGIGLFLVDAAAAGVSRRGYPTQDGLRAADINLSGVAVAAGEVIGPPGAGLPILERVVDEAIAVLAAEAVGAMAALHELTLDYLKTRRQFGVPIGSFQVLQHRAADMFVALEQARSMAYFAAMMASEDAADTRRRAMSAVKVQIGRSARFIGEQATQLHGGIGMTMEYKGGHYFKRLAMIDLAFGNADHHLRRLAQAGGLIE